MSLVRDVVVGDWVLGRTKQLWQVTKEDQAALINRIDINREAYTIFQEPVPVPPLKKRWVRLFINKHNGEIKSGENTFTSYDAAKDATWNKGFYDRFAIVEVTEGQGLEE